MHRRQLLKLSLLGSGALLLKVPLTEASALKKPQAWQASAWITLFSDNRAIMQIHKAEMGQGVSTALAQIFADEAELDWESLSIELAPAANVFRDPVRRIQFTGGSTSIANSRDVLRHAAASLRELMRTSAATIWRTEANTLKCSRSQVYNPQNQARLAYSELIHLAATLPLPDDVSLKPSEAFGLSGQSIRRLDAPAKIAGTTLYANDFFPENALCATVVQCPVFATHFDTFNQNELQAMPGISHVFTLDNRQVAIVGQSHWHVFRAAEQARLQYQQNTAEDSDALKIIAEQQLDLPGDVVREQGKPPTEFNSALTVDYQLPFLAHACMEPMSCTVEPGATAIHVWIGTQNQTACQEIVHQLSGLSYEHIHIHSCFMGGGFGRRGETDYLQHAVQIALRLKRAVRLLWSREQDIQHDYYRPQNHHRLQAKIRQNQCLSWEHHLSCPPLLKRIVAESAALPLPQWTPNFIKSTGKWIGGGLFSLLNDPTALSGAKNLPYTFSHVKIAYSELETRIPTGMWRSVGDSQNAFVVECFIDQIAKQCQQDPMHFRLQLLKDKSRHIRVLKKLRELSQWDKKDRDYFQGLAIHESFGSIVGHVMRLHRTGPKQYHLLKVFSVMDCGLCINPNISLAQVEGSIIWGLSAALSGKISIKNGRVQQSNFHDYKVVRMHQVPEMDIHILPSEEKPSGVGEPAVPPVAPALVNALLAAGETAITQLPIPASVIWD